MRIKVRELLGIGEAFGDLVDKELPIDTAIKLRKINKAVGEELQIYDPERVKILENSGCPKGLVDNGKGVKVNGYDVNEFKIKNPEKSKELEKKMAEFYEKEIELKCEPLRVKDLGNINVKPSSLILLESFIGD